MFLQSMYWPLYVNTAFTLVNKGHTSEADCSFLCWNFRSPNSLPHIQHKGVLYFSTAHWLPLIIPLDHSFKMSAVFEIERICHWLLPSNSASSNFTALIYSTSRQFKCEEGRFTHNFISNTFSQTINCSSYFYFSGLFFLRLQQIVINSIKPFMVCLILKWFQSG